MDLNDSPGERRRNAALFHVQAADQTGLAMGVEDMLQAVLPYALAGRPGRPQLAAKIDPRKKAGEPSAVVSRLALRSPVDRRATPAPPFTHHHRRTT